MLSDRMSGEFQNFAKLLKFFACYDSESENLTSSKVYFVLAAINCNSVYVSIGYINIGNFEEKYN